jgi:hypothetical protein
MVRGNVLAKGYGLQGTQNGSRSPFQRPFNAWFAAPRIVFSSAFLYVRDRFAAFRSTIPSVACADFFPRPGL